MDSGGDNKCKEINGRNLVGYVGLVSIIPHALVRAGELNASAVIFLIALFLLLNEILCKSYFENRSLSFIGLMLFCVAYALAAFGYHSYGEFDWRDIKYVDLSLFIFCFALLVYFYVQVATNDIVIKEWEG
ncbi:hypothetical protein L1F30_02890 [Simiduia sp. 21SJ11W-1]|uniref:hypothetical protein n=1 Tax=Simiduia sp. 21SJ11W-1 TaxID=2909669 RepID=UPI0020A1607F|nr:hypothetical protein [Simiduia sp. 21SJ11W-1]UTA48500.1 hypothetical protein L1F30_02890 [Simiduia sp. 21SJ11W-1]